MSLRKTLITALALAIAIAFSPLSELRAASPKSPGSQPASPIKKPASARQASAKGVEKRPARAAAAAPTSTARRASAWMRGTNSRALPALC